VSARDLFYVHGAIPRVATSIAMGIVAGVVAAYSHLDLPFVFGWNFAGLTLLCLAWLLIFRADQKATQAGAGAEDPGRTLVYAIVLLASLASLGAAFRLTRHVGALDVNAAYAEALCLITVALAWGLTHTSFTLRYAHLYYREDDEGVGGVEFPGKSMPTYMDFAYFAFTVGMCFQTSDVCVTSPVIRRAVLLHAIVSFGYNTALIAFVLNLVFGKMS